MDVVQALELLRAEGWSIIVHSCRSVDLLDAYLREHGIPFDEINPGSPYCEKTGKPLASVYWDDRALKYSGNAKDDIEMIRNFRTWNGRE